ncbi:MAG TPA: cyclophilin-like fold protein, partial [Amaricoccus sp.]|nr:cyclophilin-like fold protein [Amaricoccus sp.]
VRTGTLEDSPASRAFPAMLPLELTLTEYGATEKIGDLPQRPEGLPDGVDPAVGDITYFAPGAIWRSSIATSTIRAD